MLVKCPCQHCQGNLEFDTEQAGEFVTCPHCQQSTRLLLPIPAPQKQPVNPRLTLCPDCSNAISPRALMCPTCGYAAGVRFRFIWEIIGHIALAGLIFALIAWLIDLLIKAAGSPPVG